jgi:hypothetical protein
MGSKMCKKSYRQKSKENVQKNVPVTFFQDIFEPVSTNLESEQILPFSIPFTKFTDTFFGS